MNRRGQVSLKLLLGLLAAVLGGGGLFYGVRLLSLPAVQVTHVTTGDVVQAFYATGTISAEREYPVRARVAGVVELEPGIDKGSRVDKDQLLGRVVSDDLELKLRQAQADFKAAAERAEEGKSPVLGEFDKRIEAWTEIVRTADREYKRLLKLAETNNAQTIEIDRAYDRVKTTGAELESLRAQRAAKRIDLSKELDNARAALDIARWNIEQQDLRAPVAGTVLDWPVSTRTRVAINDLVLTVADVRPANLVVRAAVDEEDRAKLHVGQVVRMTLYSFPDDKFEGRVKTIYPKADPTRRTFEVDVNQVSVVPQTGPGSREPDTAPGPATRPATGPATAPAPAHERFAAGMTGELAFVELEKHRCTLLPRQALQGEWFYIVRDGRLDRVRAHPGARNVTRVEVLPGTGLAPNDLVLISPVGKLTPGQAVRTRFIDPRTAADLNKPKDTGVFKGGF